jgi:NRAMP (natural resistance-associated macrophage protein)-like metal ion transporter
MTPRQRHHAHRHRLSGFGYFRRLGPGLITGASDDDPSGIGTYSQVGAAYGYRFLWTALVALPLAAAVQEAAARLGLCTGKGLAALIKKRFPRGVLYAAVALVCAANVFNIGADLGAMAASARLIVPLPQAMLVGAITLVLLGLEVFVSYRRYAQVLRWLTLSLAAYVVVLFVSGPDWGEVARNTLIPSIGHGRAALAALIAIFGTTVSPYLFFWQASEEVEEEHEKGRGAGTVDDGHLRLMRVDVLAGMASAVVVMFSIMVASAVTLNGHGITSVQTADQAAGALRPIAGSVAGLLFALGVVGTGALAVPVLAGSTAYALAETFGWREGLYRRLRDAEGFYGAIAASMAVGIALDFFGVNPIRTLYYSAILNGLAAPPLILLMLVLSTSRGVLGRRSGGRLSIVLLAIALVVMAGLPLAYLLS